MPKYYVEVVAHGRINITVEAENEEDAENKAYDHPDFPYFDKVYECNATVFGEA